VAQKMKLKKNDKIILVVGVVILIAAGVGIALYNVDNSDNTEVKEDSNLFSYTWIKKTGVISLTENEYVSNKEPYETLLSVTSPTDTVLTSIVMTLSWEDDQTYGLLTEKGVDTLTAEISRGSDIKTITSEGGGNETLTFTVNSIPVYDTVEAASTNDAMDLIDDIVSGQNKATFNIMVSVTTGEKIWRLLKYLKDKGNDFDLMAEYTYYYYEFDMNSSSNNNDNTKNTGGSLEDFGHNLGDFYINLGYGRGMI
jgi:flagellar basal body-associated protein FliL